MLHQGQVVFERSEESDLVRPEWDENMVLESDVSRLALPKSLGIVSGGIAAVKSARIVVDGTSIL